MWFLKWSLRATPHLGIYTYIKGTSYRLGFKKEIHNHTQKETVHDFIGNASKFKPRHVYKPFTKFTV